MNWFETLWKKWRREIDDKCTGTGARPSGPSSDRFVAGWETGQGCEISCTLLQMVDSVPFGWWLIASTWMVVVTTAAATAAFGGCIKSDKWNGTKTTFNRFDRWMASRKLNEKRDCYLERFGKICHFRNVTVMMGAGSNVDWLGLVTTLLRWAWESEKAFETSRSISRSIRT